MVGTIYSPAGMEALMPDNTSQLISPAITRNIPESAAGVITSMYPANVIPNPTLSGAVVGSSGGAPGTLQGTLPTGWSVTAGNLVTQVIAFGILPQGYPYIDLKFSGTTSTTGLAVFFSGNSSPTGTPITVANYTESFFAAYIAGATTNITGFYQTLDTFTSGGSYVSTPLFATVSLSSTLTSFGNTVTPAATSAWGMPGFQMQFSSGVQIGGAAAGITVRLAIPQMALTSTAASYTPVIGDRGTIIKANWSAPFTVTVPPSVFTGGMNFGIRQVGAGQVTVVPGSGVSFGPVTNGYTTRTQGSLIWVTADADLPNFFWIDGDLS